MHEKSFHWRVTSQVIYLKVSALYQVYHFKKHSRFKLRFFVQSPQFGTRKRTSEQSRFFLSIGISIGGICEKIREFWAPQIGIVLFGKNNGGYWSNWSVPTYWFRGVPKNTAIWNKACFVKLHTALRSSNVNCELALQWKNCFCFGSDWI